MKPRIINMWSGPRNLSTAMMYAWRQRPDTTVWDEPMYGHFLVITGIDHPGREETIAATLTDRDDVVDEMLHGTAGTSIRFYKNMAHHLVGFDLSIVDRMDNFLLTRDPVRMLPSLARGLGRVPTLRDTGFTEQIEILERIEATGRKPVVVDSSELLLDPEGVLQLLCAAMDVSWDPAMLNWPAGPKAEDGVWAPYWYGRLHETTGFEKTPPGDPEPLPPDLEPLYQQCAPLFDRLRSYALEAR